MSIAIKKELCVGCGKCTMVCPGNLLRKESLTNKAYIKYPSECWGCASCLKECKYGAIHYYLGADIGGNGTIMYVEEREEKLHWHFRKGNEKTTIIIDPKQANSY